MKRTLDSTASVRPSQDALVQAIARFSTVRSTCDGGRIMDRLTYGTSDHRATPIRWALSQSSAAELWRERRASEHREEALKTNQGVQHTGERDNGPAAIVRGCRGNLV